MIRKTLDALLFLIVFVLIQLFTTYLVVGMQYYGHGVDVATIGDLALKGQLAPDMQALIGVSVASSVLTLVVFLWARWTPVGRNYLASRPWATLAWVVILALGTVIPSEYLAERMPYDMPKDVEALLAGMMHNRWGYLAVGILAPLAEEVVFRGAVLRVLLRAFDGRLHWVAIGLSALLFGLVHGNVPQGVHATLIGLLLGWMYYRTHSLVPGILFHWVNNTVAYVLANLMPGIDDAQLSDVFKGGELHVLMAVGFSFLLVLPALFQLYLRLRPARK